MKMRMLCAVSAGLMMAASLRAAAPAPAPAVSAPMAASVAATSLAVTAVAFQQYYPGPGIYCGVEIGCAPIAYSHEVYSDAGLTNLIGSGNDTCSGSGSQIYVNSPQLPTGYDVQTQMYVCTDFGPYLPPEW